VFICYVFKSLLTTIEKLLQELADRIDIQGNELQGLLHKLKERIVDILTMSKEVAGVLQFVED
jgi:hypothetical protein